MRFECMTVQNFFQKTILRNNKMYEKKDTETKTLSVFVQ